MTQKSNSGYQGKVLDLIKKTGCTVGDIILVEKEDKLFEGTLIPRSEYSDNTHIVIKLKNGYNLGIRVTSETKIKKIGKGTKPSFTVPSLPETKFKLTKSCYFKYRRNNC